MMHTNLIIYRLFSIFSPEYSAQYLQAIEIVHITVHIQK